MIENLMYAVLSVQIYFLANRILSSAVSIPGFKRYLPLVALGIAAFFYFILFAMKLNKLASLTLSFIFGFVLYGFNYLFNFLTFLSLYLYIIGKLKEKRILNKERAFMLSPVLLLGFIPFRIKGVFEGFLQRKIHTLLYSVNSGSGKAHSGGSGTISVNRVRSYFQNAGNVSRAMFHSSKTFESFIILFALLILLAILLMFLAKFYLVSKSKKAFLRTFITGISVFAGVILLISYLFFTMVKLYNTVASGIKSGPGITGNFSNGSRENLTAIVKKVIQNEQFASKMGNTMQIVGILIAVLGIILGVALVYAIWKILFSDRSGETLFDKKESKIFEKKIRQKGIEYSLSEIQDPYEYVKFLYFSVIYLLREKGFSMEKFETPNEFLVRISRILEKPINNFDRLTNLFNEVKYGKPARFSLEEIKTALHPEQIISEVRNLPSKRDMAAKKDYRNTQRAG